QGAIPDRLGHRPGTGDHPFHPGGPRRQRAGGLRSDRGEHVYLETALPSGELLKRPAPDGRWDCHRAPVVCPRRRTVWVRLAAPHGAAPGEAGGPAAALEGKPPNTASL